ncbi:MAG: putative 4-mercaptohistidine N1-methyltransferase [Rubritalea sp.]|jgi:putative 4-mercaptohistidine N1-methyltranferase
MNYESEKVLSDYILMHFGEHDQRMPWGIGKLAALDFPLQTVSYFTQKRVALSLDLGCAVGASAFHLSKTSAKVIGIDFSKLFIDTANQLKENGEIDYRYQEEGSNFTPTTAKIPEGSVAANVSFAVGDAMNLPEGFKGFDRVHAANLICRLPDPMMLLDRLPSLVKQGGELVLATPFSWSEEFTAKENIPKGDSWEWLQAALEKHFECINHADEVFTIRDHVRKFQLGVSKVSHWRRL